MTTNLPTSNLPKPDVKYFIPYSEKIRKMISEDGDQSESLFFDEITTKNRSERITPNQRIRFIFPSTPKKKTANDNESHEKSQNQK
jgi:hypothetical protein